MAIYARRRYRHLSALGGGVEHGIFWMGLEIVYYFNESGALYWEEARLPD
jgi:hypothetical protein